MSSAHAPQNLPADLNESSQQQQNTHELADGCDDADTYLSASFVFLSQKSLSSFFAWGSLVHTSDLWESIESQLVFFVLRDYARPEDVGFARRETRRARRFAAFCCSGRTKSGRCVLWPLVFFRPLFFSSRSRYERNLKGRVSGAFPQKKKRWWWTQNLTKSIVSF